MRLLDSNQIWQLRDVCIFEVNGVEVYMKRIWVTFKKSWHLYSLYQIKTVSLTPQKCHM